MSSIYIGWANAMCVFLKFYKTVIIFANISVYLNIFLHFSTLIFQDVM